MALPGPALILCSSILADFGKLHEASSICGDPDDVLMLAREIYAEPPSILPPPPPSFVCKHSSLSTRDTGDPFPRSPRVNDRRFDANFPSFRSVNDKSQRAMSEEAW